MPASGENLALILNAWMGMLRTGDPAPLSAILDDNVVWEGILPGQRCVTRDEVLDLMVRNRGRPPRITGIEAAEFGERVVVSVTGPDFGETDVHTAEAPRSLVFVFAGERAMRIISTRTRDEAFRIAEQPAAS